MLTARSLFFKLGQNADAVRHNLKKAEAACVPVLASYIPYLLRSIVFHVKTLYLFTCGDIQTFLLPIIFFVWAASPSLTFSQFLRGASWVWLHLLQYSTSAQCLSANYDKYTKPWLPVPAARMTERQTESFRWLLLPACLAQSLYYGVPAQGVMVMFVIMLINEFKMEKNWLTRHVLRAALFITLDKAALIICGATPDQLDYPAYLTPLLALTTLHAQDFTDTTIIRNKRLTPTQRAIPRQLVRPAPHTLARLSLLIGLPLWSVALVALNVSLSTASMLTLAALSLTGTYVGVGFWLWRHPDQDCKSFTRFGLWLIAARVLSALL